MIYCGKYKIWKEGKEMGLGTFRGGIHPFEGKEMSEEKPIQILNPKGELVFPMAQHIGAPAQPIVGKGDSVLVGQRIGEAQGFISAHVLSSISGTVKSVELRRTSSGGMVNSIVIENDGAYNTIDDYGKKRVPEGLSKDEIRGIIKDAGIVGLGGAGFPTHVKLTPKDDTGIEYVLVNGAECEPYLTSDYRLMLESPESLIGGLKVILQLFEKAKGIIGIEDNKPEAIEKISQMVKDEPRITVCPLKTKYPQGGERSLIYACTGRTINSSMLPADAGCVVDNVDTVNAIYKAVCESTPLIERVITVTGDAVKNPQNYYVRFGTNYKELIEAAGGFTQQPEKIIAGGPMMGTALFTDDIPTIKTNSSILAMKKDDVAAMESSPCIRCGKCVEVCPSNIVPEMMMKAALKNNYERFERINGMECMECGSCSYICPAKRQLTQAFKEMRKTILANRRKKA